MDKSNRTILQRSRLEVWGGIECTINRVGNEFRDQLQYSGHYSRRTDIRDIAQLNISSLRYPVLWERHQLSESGSIDWRWVERQLNEIRENGITPIVGLLHHGSGPEFTNLLDPAFPEKFAKYAGMVAEKFPWINQYVPINEPLTTARFSALYGHWYPHEQSPSAFAKALINQLAGTVLAMQNIRKINPHAQFIQTEDITKVHSEPSLSYQADFENQRRWLTFDLLYGKVTPSTPMWTYLLSVGITRGELEFFIDNSCEPDMLGLNYYVTSERYLDSNVEQYAPELRGGNGIDEYVDTEAMRVGKSAGPGYLMDEIWERYKKPMAMTEVQIACTSDEQIRWFADIWEACTEASARGIDIRAVTSWSLLGAYDWNSLLTKHDFVYECGAFEVNNGSISLTELGKAISSIGETGEFNYPEMISTGWWSNRVEVY